MEPLTQPWSALSLRLSAFLIPGPSADMNVWMDTFGEEPETDQRFPRQQARIQSGRRDRIMVQLHTSPVRIDWHMLPDPEQQQGLSVEIGPVRDSALRFGELAKTWLSRTDMGIIRLAFGVNAVQKVSDRREAYRGLQRLLKSVKIDPDRSRDMFYQINWPVPSSVLGEGARLNRLTKWAALLVNFSQLPIVPGVVLSQIPAQATSEQYVSLECDHNTPVDRVDALDSPILARLYDELVHLAWENLEYGEVI